jgi:hypothetical protein
MKGPKILALASAVDLDFRYGCTPAWWQLWKGMAEIGVDLIVTPYRGRAVESPWWRTEPNPLYREAETFARARDLAARLKGDRYLRRAEDNPEESRADRAVREVVWRYVTPRWQRHVEQILERERDVDAVLVFTIPMSHLRGIPTRLRERFGVPVVFYDGDVPMSLPEFGGMDTGFNYYHGADPSEYDLVVSNSEGGIPRLLELGARRAEPLFWAADPDLFHPLGVEKDYDVFFYGYGDKFRRDWMAAMVGEPSRALPEIDFALGGRDFQGDTGRARLIGDVPFNAFNRAISAARVNLNMTRRSHASVFASSTARPFELDRLEPVRGDRALVRAGARPRRRRERRAGDRDAARARRRPRCGRGARAARAGAGARRAHLRASRAAAARPARARCDGPGGGGVTELAPTPSVPEPVPGLSALRRVAIVPAHDEQASIAHVVAEIQEFDPGMDVVVVDDGSHDRTAGMADDAGAHVLRLPFNLGIGGAVQTGFRYAFEHGYDVAVRLDGDGQHDASELPKILAPVVAGEADLVVGTRFGGGASGEYRSTAVRRVGIRFFAWVVSRLVGQRVTDTTSGFQAAGRRAIALFAVDYPHDYPEVEATVMCVKHKLRLREVPVEMRERGGGRSSITALRSIYYMVKVLLAIFVGLFRRNVVPQEDA